MANITEILGTDSVSSSRPTINGNFELLNDELSSVTALLNPTTGVLTGVTAATVQQISVVNNAVSLLVVNASGVAVGTTANFTKAVTFGGNIVKSGVSGTAAAPITTSPNSFDKSAYFISMATFALPAGVDGQEVTLISASATATAFSGTFGATSISLDGLNSTITLRCFNSTWYVISSHKCTIV